jgi:putative addiction module component (TIGR02574 family)
MRDVGVDPKDKLLEAVLGLPVEDRAEMASRLIESLGDGPEDADAAAAWADEIERRVREVDEGRVQLIPWEEVRARLRARLKQS